MYLSWNWLSLHLCPKISFTKFFDFNFLLRGSTSPFLYGPIFCELFLFLYGPILWTFSISCSYVFPSSFTLLATSFALFNSSFFITILIGWSFFFLSPKMTTYLPFNCVLHGFFPLFARFSQHPFPAWLFTCHCCSKISLNSSFLCCSVVFHLAFTTFRSPKASFIFSVLV